MNPKSKKDQCTVECENAEQTIRVLNYINRDNDRGWSHHWKYVTRIGYYDSDIEDINKYEYPVISFKEWQSLPDEEFVLPEKWYIIVNEENKIKVNNWYCNGDTFLKPYLHICGMVKQYGSIVKGYNELPNIKNGDGNDSSYDFGFEITFDQFKEHVLKEIPNPEYDPKDVAFKPVGYKFKYPKLKNVVTAILGDIEVYKTDSYDFPLKSSVYQELKELQVLDLWCDKVLFEKKSITLKSGVKLSEDDIAEVKEILNTGNRKNNLI